MLLRKVKRERRGDEECRLDLKAVTVTVTVVACNRHRMPVYTDCWLINESTIVVSEITLCWFVEIVSFHCRLF